MVRTGRPRAFDREAALNTAMRLFWAQGYEPTSLSQLKTAMGDLSSASFYAAFGSKEALFREALELYLATYGRSTESLQDDAMPPREALETALRRSAQMQTANDHPPGCLIAMGASNCSPENAHIAALVEQVRTSNRLGIEALLMRARSNGEFADDCDTAPLAALFANTLSGIAVEARDGRPLETLNAAITTAMTVWDAHARPH